MPLFSRFNSCNLNPDSTAPRKLGDEARTDGVEGRYAALLSTRAWRSETG